MNDDPKLELSTLCQTIKQDGVEIDVQIYRLEGEDLWQLEVVDEEAASTVWEETFKDDQAALDEVLNVIKEEGIRTFFSDHQKTLH